MDPDETIAELKARVEAISSGGEEWGKLAGSLVLKELSDAMRFAEDGKVGIGTPTAAAAELARIRAAKKTVAVDLAAASDEMAAYPDMNVIAAELERKNAAARAEVARGKAKVASAAAAAVKAEVFSGLRKSLYDSRYLRKDHDGSRKTTIAPR